MVPNLVENPNFCILVCELFANKILTGELMHSTSQWCRAAQLYCLNYEVSIMFCCQLCSTGYTAVQIGHRSSHYEKVMKGSHHMLLPNQQFTLSAKMNGTQRMMLVSP